MTLHTTESKYDEKMQNTGMFSSFISHHSSLQFKRRFTLIELLVVIAILSILAGMLLPALSKVKDTAKGITCLNNMKMVGSVFNLYASAFDDYIPPPYGTLNGKKYTEWWFLLMENADPKGYEYYLDAVSKKKLNTKKMSSMIGCFFCPGMLFESGQNSSSFEGKWNINYAISPTVTDSKRAAVTPGWSSPYKFMQCSKVTNPGERSLFLDYGSGTNISVCVDLNYMTRTNYPEVTETHYVPGAAGEAASKGWRTVKAASFTTYEGSLNDAVKGRHNGSSNILLHDGHAEAPSRTELGRMAYGLSATNGVLTKAHILFASMP